ncbi:MAG: beta-galactosidase [Anaerolineae bacterium]
MYYGADYYPEHWPQERWEIDARLMQEAGINLVRMGEFAWSLYEPQEGVYHWEWLEEAIATLAAHGVSTVLGTPTATPPAWMCQAYPEIMAWERNGHQVTFGERRQYCPTNVTYRKLSQRIAAAMAERFKGNPNVVAWQIDNEFGGHHPRCYCPACQRAFQDWVRSKYGSLDTLASAWGTHFWSHDYTSWAQIPLPIDSNGVSNPCLELDFYRFSSDQWVSFQQNQLDILRQIVPARQKITHNFMGFNFQEIDYFDLARELDFVSWDNYPIFQTSNPAHIALNHAAMRGLKDRPFWVMEEQSGPSGWQVMSRQPRPGQIRLWAYQAIAHGADAIVFFRWRTCQFNTEEYWHGILEHHGQPRRRYLEVQQMGREIARIGDSLTGMMPPKHVALILSYDDIRTLRLQPGAQGLSYNEVFTSYYCAFHRLGMAVDIVPPDADLTPYRLVVAPVLHLVKQTWADNLRSYVRQGGTLFVGARSGVKDDSSRIVDEPLPGLLSEMCGVEVEEYDAIGRANSCQVIPEANLAAEFPLITGHTWCDILTPLATTEVLGRYASDYYTGKAAFTRHQFGQGTAYYLGTMVGTGEFEPIAKWLTRQLGIEHLPGLPEGIEVTRRQNNKDQVLYILNHTDTGQTVPLSGEWQDLLADNQVSGSVDLTAYGVAVLTKPIRETSED